MSYTPPASSANLQRAHILKPKSPKAKFCRQTFHVRNLIPIWVDPNDKVRQLIQTSNLINRTNFNFKRPCSNVELLMYRIQFFQLTTWKDQHFNQLSSTYVIWVKFEWSTQEDRLWSDFVWNVEFFMYLILKEIGPVHETLDVWIINFNRGKFTYSFIIIIRPGRSVNKLWNTTVT